MFMMPSDTSVEYHLDYVLYGQPSVDVPADSPLVATGVLDSSSVRLIGEIPLAPLPKRLEAQSHAYALVPYPGPTPAPGLLWAVALQAANTPWIGGFYIPYKAWASLSINLAELAEQTSEHVFHRVAAPLTVKTTQWARLLSTETILEQTLALPGVTMEALISLLSASLHTRHLQIRGFAPNARDRLLLIQSLMILLPAVQRASLTFSLYCPIIPHDGPSIIFADGQSPTRWVWQVGGRFDVPDTLYTAYLKELWRSTQDIAAFTKALDTMPNLSPVQPKTETAALVALLSPQAAMPAQPASAETLLAAAIRDAVPQGEARAHYYERLLQIALDERHEAAGEFVAQAMEDDPALDAALEPLLSHALENEPDAVYAFVRQHLNHHTDDHWLTRLRVAAIRSLEIAIEAGDAGTLVNWLRLIAREPNRYQLSDVLHEGILAARSRLGDCDNLAVDLLALAVKRDVESVPILLSDDDMMHSLPPLYVAALRMHDSTAIEALSALSRELFLLAVAQAAEAAAPSITVNSVRMLWDFYQARSSFTIAQEYHPATLMAQLIYTPEALVDGALPNLLTYTLLDKTHEDWLKQILPAPLSEEVVDALPIALEQSGRSIEDIAAFINALITEGKLTYAQAAALYGSLVQRDVLPHADQLADPLARLLYQHAEVDVEPSWMLRLLEIAAETRSEPMMKVALKRMLFDCEEMPTETAQVDALIKLRKLTSWSTMARTLFLGWWRGYARQQSVAQLQKLEKLLETKRIPGLEDEVRGILQTALAVRRVIGQRTLEEFAREVNIACRVLQALADGFDPEDKDSAPVDAATLKSFLTSRAEELAPDVRQVLATDLKTLAHVVTSLAENRTRPTLLSRDDSLDRALMSGEQPPESALDVMKFLSGFLDGSQQHRHEGL